MEKGKSAAAELTSALKNLRLSKPILSASLSDSLSLPINKSKPRRLVSLCLGLLGQYFEEITTDISEIAAVFPSDIKLALLAIARRRQLLNDEVLIALAENSWELLDISGSGVTDFGLGHVARICTNLRAVDISRCDKVTSAGLSELICHCKSLEILRCGGSPRSDFTTRRCLNLLKPKLNVVEEESWEELDSNAIGNGAESLRWLVWPKIDEDSEISLATECPRIIVNPQPSQFAIRGVPVPREALAGVVLDHFIVEDIDPRTWAVSGAARRAPVPPVPPSPDDNPELPIAEKFRLAFLERDARLAPKRAKNERQHRRRAEREYFTSSTSAKSIALASQASKFLHNRS